MENVDHFPKGTFVREKLFIKMYPRVYFGGIMASFESIAPNQFFERRGNIFNSPLIDY